MREERRQTSPMSVKNRNNNILVLKSQSLYYVKLSNRSLRDKNDCVKHVIHSLYCDKNVCEMPQNVCITVQIIHQYVRYLINYMDEI